MLLRNKKLITSIANSLNMPDAIQNQGGVGGSGSPYQTTVLTTRTGVTNFCGRVNGELTQSVEVFIASIDNYVAAKNIVDPSQILTEAKSFLDLSKGDMGHWSRSMGFRSCKSWEDLKVFLRKVYGGSKQVGIVRELSNLIRHCDRGG